MKPVFDEALDWLWNNEPTQRMWTSLHCRDKPTLQRQANLTENPMPRNLIPESKEGAIDITMDWFKNVLGTSKSQRFKHWRTAQSKVLFPKSSNRFLKKLLAGFTTTNQSLVTLIIQH